MDMRLDAVRARVGAFRSQAEWAAVAVFALVLSVGLGVAARRRVATARANATALSIVESEISAFRSAFRPGAPEQDVRMRLPDSLRVGVPRDDRVSLAERIAARAERAGLSEVRVRFAPPDSAAPPTRPDLASAAVSVADYTLAVDCAGGFGEVLSLVSQLPPSVAVQRLVAVKTDTGATYHLVLAVFEAAGASQHG